MGSISNPPKEKGEPPEGSINTAELEDDAVTEPKLSEAVRAKLNAIAGDSGRTAIGEEAIEMEIDHSLGVEPAEVLLTYETDAPEDPIASLAVIGKTNQRIHVLRSDATKPGFINWQVR